VTPFMCYHSTARRHRESIEQYGLLCNLPNAGQHFGIYCFSDDLAHTTREYRRSKRAWCRWGHREPNDLWQVGYCGPMLHDRWVTNGIVLLERPQYVSRVSQLSQVTVV